MGLSQDSTITRFYFYPERPTILSDKPGIISSDKQAEQLKELARHVK
jgi:hypothetical protein